MKFDFDKFSIAIVIVWVISILISLGLLGAVVYVAYHFIAKYW